MPPLFSPATISDAFDWAIQILDSKEIVSPQTEIEWLLTDLLDSSRADLYLLRHEYLTPSQHCKFQNAVYQRKTRIPLQHILGKTEFFSLPFKIDSKVFIPRPETEILVENLVDRLKDHSSIRILDLGTGSGVIAVALAHNLPNCKVVASDLSTEALRIAKENACLNQVDRFLTFVRGNLLSPFPLRPTFHAIASNPPYIPTDILLTLQPEIWKFEPHPALDGGPDGLLYSKIIIEQASSYLYPGGWLALEIGENQSIPLANMFPKTFKNPEKILDLAGIERVLIAQKMGN